MFCVKRLCTYSRVIDREQTKNYFFGVAKVKYVVKFNMVAFKLPYK